MFSRIHPLLLLPLLLLPSCKPEKKKETPAPVLTNSETEQPALTHPIGEGIVLVFPHKIMLDVTTGSNDRVMRKILVQTLNQPADDARRQLENSLKLAGFKSIGSQIGVASAVQFWSKDGKPMNESVYGISIQTTPQADERYPTVTGLLGIDINRQAH